MSLFPMERLIEMVGESVGEGRDPDEVVAEFVEGELCSPEEGVRLREHFSGPSDASRPVEAVPAVSTGEPLEAETFSQPSDSSSLPALDTVTETKTEPPSRISPVRPESIAEPDPADIARNQSKRPDLVLHIDWGMELKPGINLLPQFTIRGASAQCRPLLYFPLDPRIPQKDWETLPSLNRTPDGWSFDQPFRLEEGGHYKIRLVLIDPMPGFTDPGYYHVDFRIEVADPHDTGQRRKVKIQADGNLVANLDRFGKNADIEIVGDHVTLLARDESPIDALQREEKKPDEDAPIWMTNIPFRLEPDFAPRIPYLFQPDVSEPVSRLSMSESEKRRIFLIGGRRLCFGRDVPEELCWNDVPLEILPGTEDEQAHADEFAILNRLFSREHARIEVGKMGVFLADVRQGGIQDATVLDDAALAKGSEALLFSNDETTVTSRIVQFSKLLAMQLTPYYETLLEESLRKNLPETLPQRLLSSLYSLDFPKGLSSICIKPDRYYRQKPYAESLLKILKSTPLPESSWWKKWFACATNIDPRHGANEHWFVPLFVTLGRDRTSAIKLENRQWNDVRLRILYINDSLFVENVSRDSGVEYGFRDTLVPLVPFRPVTLASGLFVQKGNARLRFE